MFFRFALARSLSLTLLASLMLVACGGSDTAHDELSVPAAPIGLGMADSAPPPDPAQVPAYVDFAYTNQRGDARYATLETNAGVRVVSGFLDLWRPSTLLVDAGVTAAANANFPAIISAQWSGIPGDSSDGSVLNAAVHNANIQYVIQATTQRRQEQEMLIYLDDRRGKGYSVTDGMGPLTEAWRSAARQITSITEVAADANSIRYNDTGNNLGVGGNQNPEFGQVVDFVGSASENGSTEPAKRFYKYARPWRWSSQVQVLPTLEPAKSTSPATDGGFISGHSAEAMRDALAMAYVVPERFQEMLSRGLELGESRILSGMHSPLDVIGGRVQAQAVVAASLSNGAAATIKTAAYQQAHTTLMAAAGVTTLGDFNQYAHAQNFAADRFSDHVINRADYLRRLTFGFAQTGATDRPALVPKGAEVLLETRLPYLSAEQRRVVLKSTALPSGYPILDDAEGWGRLNFFAAADGYGTFDGDVSVDMDASQGGFNALDNWRNPISGLGKLSKQGTGRLELSGQNTYSGGTELKTGILQANNASALGLGDVYLHAGQLINAAPQTLRLDGAFTVLDSAVVTLNWGNNGAGSIQVAGNATLLGGTLKLVFPTGSKPAPGTVYTVLTAGKVNGTFKSVQSDGLKLSLIKNPSSLQVRVDG